MFNSLEKKAKTRLRFEVLLEVQKQYKRRFQTGLSAAFIQNFQFEMRQMELLKIFKSDVWEDHELARVS